MMKRLLTPIGARSWLMLGIILIVPPGATAALAAPTVEKGRDTYVQAVSDEKRNAQSKVVEMLLPGIRRAVR